MSEIDDIFSSKGKTRTDRQVIASTSSLSQKKKKKDKKRKHDTQDEAIEITDDGSFRDSESRPSKKRTIPETVVDPSSLPSTVKRPKVDKAGGGKPKSAKTEKNDDEERYKDSRGSGPRRKTKEGWNIYKEGELGIRDGGGDTPLCPFDCDCCF